MRRIAAMSSAETPSLLASFACVAATSPCEGVVVVVSSEVAPVVPLFFVADMWCIEPTGGRARSATVGAGGVGLQWVLVESVSGMDGHYNSTE